MRVVCDKISHSTVFVFEDDGNTEDLSELQELEFQADGLFPCEIRKNSHVYIAQQHTEEEEYFLFGMKKNGQSLELLAVAFPPLTLDQWEKSVLAIFGKYIYYNK